MRPRLSWLLLVTLAGCEPVEAPPPPPPPTLPSIPDAPPEPAVETPPARVDDAPPAPKRAAEAKDETPSLSATLMKVTDGDTIVVKLDGKRERVRLVGIDTPETANSPRGPQPYADEATAALERLLGRGRLALRFDAEERDHYGRLLAYVYASDGTFVNEAMVRDGWARALRVPPNVRHAKHFESLAREARRARRGIWAGG